MTPNPRVALGAFWHGPRLGASYARPDARWRPGWTRSAPGAVAEHGAGLAWPQPCRRGPRPQRAAIQGRVLGQFDVETKRDHPAGRGAAVRGEARPDVEEAGRRELSESGTESVGSRDRRERAARIDYLAATAHRVEHLHEQPRLAG